MRRVGLAQVVIDHDHTSNTGLQLVYHLRVRRVASYLPLLVLTVLAAWPLILYGPPLQAEAITDGPNHLYRFVSLDWHIRHGDLYPRWFANLHFGFGAPVLNFYAPLSYYTLVLLHLLVPSAPATFGAGFILAMGLAVVGMYTWARDQFRSPEAGLTAAAAYCTTPYLYNGILDRAAYPEAWAMAMIPWLFWGGFRLVTQPTPRLRLAFILLYASLILTHNLSALLFTPLLILYVFLLWLDRRPVAGSVWPTLSLSLLHSLGLAAFFLLPFLAESSYVQLERTKVYTYVASFITPQEMFSRPVPFDPDRIVNTRPYAAPWPQLLLMAVGLTLTATRRNQRWRRLTIVQAITIAILLWLASPASAPLWGVFPFSELAKFIQFPFRWLGPAMLLLGWMSGAAIANLPTGRLQRLVTLSCVTIFFLYSLTWTYHEPFSHFADTIRPIDIIRDEIAHPTRIGTTNLQEFLPRWVEQIPPSDTLLPGFDNSDFPSRSGSLPADITRLQESTSLNRVELDYDAPRPITAPFNIFYFPGWTATLDDQPIPVHPSSTYGLIEINLPGGRHTLRLTLQPTLPQQIGTLISCLAALALLFLRQPRPIAQSLPISRPGDLSGAYALLLGLLLASRLLVFDRIETPFKRSALNHLTHPLAIHFGDQLELIGADYADGTIFTSGQTLPVTLYWRALTPLAKDYQVSIQLVDRYGNRFGNSDNPNPGGLPTSQWKADHYARDEHMIPAISGAPPGTYRLLVNVYSIDNSAPLTAEVNGTSSGPEIEIGTVTVVRPPPEPPGPLRLVESSLAVESVSVGDPVPFTMIWRSGDQPLPKLSATITLTDEDGQTIFSTVLPPAGPDYATDQWSLDERVLYPHTLLLPPDLPAGRTKLSVTLTRDDGTPMAGPFDLGSITVTVPERSFSIPPIMYPRQYDFNNTIRLLGYDLAPGAITLYWQALHPIPERLTVFVHRFDSTGAFTGGHDSPPLRSTTSWLPGEVITDVHPLEVGDRFEVGLYESVTGQRFGAPFAVTQ